MVIISVQASILEASGDARRPLGVLRVLCGADRKRVAPRRSGRTLPAPPAGAAVIGSSTFAVYLERSGSPVFNRPVVPEYAGGEQIYRQSVTKRFRTA